MKLRELGEDRLLEQLLRPLPSSTQVIAGPGDDVAIVRPPSARHLVVLKTDCVVENIHFTKTASPDAVGRKAMMRPLSDFAAAAAVPRFALVTLIISKERRVQWVKAMYRGLARAARLFRVNVVGGETSDTSGPTVISVSLCGFVEHGRWISRCGGRAGDHLFVTGRLGGANKGKHLRFVPRIVEARWLTTNFRIRAMMDLSDGLGADLPRLARASNIGFEIDPIALPRNPGATVENAISDGEDYELLFAVAPSQSARLEKAWRRKFPRLPLTRIGRLNSNPRAVSSKLVRGYVHFQ